MSNALNIKHVIFDMDGTILDTERFCFRCHQEWFQGLGYSFTEDIYRQIIGCTLESSITVLKEFFPDDLDYDRIFKQVEALEDKKLSEGARIEIKEGYFALRDYLQKQNITMILGTSTYREKAIKRLKQSGIFEDFAFILCGDEVEHGKPAPDIYARILERMKISPQESIAIEDSANGVKSAAAAGLSVIMVPDMVPASDEIEKLLLAQKENLEAVIDVIDAFRK